MFKTRLISGIILVALTFVVLWLGGPVTGVAMLLLSVVGVFELCRVYKIEKRSPAVFAYIWTGLYYIVLMLSKQEMMGVQLSRMAMPVMITYLLVILAIYVIRFPEYHDKEIMAAFMSFFYVSVMLSYIYRIREMNNGGFYVALVFLCSWGNDTLAYCVGVLFGKHKMSPVLSPKKSIEGLIGGIVGAGLLGLIYGFFIRNYLDNAGNLPLYLFSICALGALPAVIGDLAASAIKRNNEVKDYGKLIPGHGGVLDRFDSLIFTAPIIYYLIEFMI